MCHKQILKNRFPSLVAGVTFLRSLDPQIPKPTPSYSFNSQQKKCLSVKEILQCKKVVTSQSFIIQTLPPITKFTKFSRNQKIYFFTIIITLHHPSMRRHVLSHQSIVLFCSPLKPLHTFLQLLICKRHHARYIEYYRQHTILFFEIKTNILFTGGLDQIENSK